jgi:hypothetical protein
VSEKVIFLAYTNPKKLEQEWRDALSCKVCRNKTYTLTWVGEQSFPLLQCAACGSHAGYWGFAGDTPPELDPPPESAPPESS